MFEDQTCHRPAVCSTVRMLALGVLFVAAWSDMAAYRSARAADLPDLLYYCSSCHGPGGRSPSPMFPHLAGQQKDYIIKQLQDFRNDTRTAPHAQTYLDYLVMWGLVTQLDPPTTDAIAAFYASQPPAAGLPAALPDVAAGRRIYTEGIPSENVPACVGCHGPSAQGTDSIPRLAGQYQAYLAHQLDAFAAWTRQNVTMHAVSLNLTPEQILDVSAYLATL